MDGDGGGPPDRFSHCLRARSMPYANRPPVPRLSKAQELRAFDTVAYATLVLGLALLNMLSSERLLPPRNIGLIVFGVAAALPLAWALIRLFNRTIVARRSPKRWLEWASLAIFPLLLLGTGPFAAERLVLSTGFWLVEGEQRVTVRVLERRNSRRGPDRVRLALPHGERYFRVPWSMVFERGSCASLAIDTGAFGWQRVRLLDYARCPAGPGSRRR